MLAIRNKRRITRVYNLVSYWKIKYERARTNLANEWERADTQEASWDGRFVWTRLMKPLQRLHQNGTRDLVTAATLRLRIYSWPAKYFVPTQSACGFRWIMHSWTFCQLKSSNTRLVSTYSHLHYQSNFSNHFSFTFLFDKLQTNKFFKVIKC